MRRILLYSHDTFGLGHIRRTQKIATSLANKDTTILVACASPVARAFTNPTGIEYLNLPGYQKLADGKYQPRGLNIPLDEFIKLRSSLLYSTVKDFRPDLLIIDKEPQGVGGELMPALEYLREKQKSCHVVCGFRDILDEKAAVLREWQSKNTLPVLQDLFDSILVYGEKQIFDFGTEYDLPTHIKNKLRYTGYIQPEKNFEIEVPLLNFAQKLPLVTLTLGGGGDGWEFLDTFLECLAAKPQSSEFNSVILTGPFVSAQLLNKARELASQRSDLIVFEFLSNTEALFRRSDVVISMGGYNTSTELAHLRKYPLVLPRVNPRKEQLIRAETFSQRGLCNYIHPQNLTTQSLYQRIIELLDGKRPPAPVFKTDGLSNIRSILLAELSA